MGGVFKILSDICISHILYIPQFWRNYLPWSYHMTHTMGPSNVIIPCDHPMWFIPCGHPMWPSHVTIPCDSSHVIIPYDPSHVTIPCDTSHIQFQWKKILFGLKNSGTWTVNHNEATTRQVAAMVLLSILSFTSNGQVITNNLLLSCVIILYIFQNY